MVSHPHGIKPISSIQGVGVGLRRDHFGSLLSGLPPELQFFEVAPENYIDIGGRIYRDFCELVEKVPVIAHSVSLSLGSLDPLQKTFLQKLKKWIHQHRVPLASDHICFSSFQGVQFDDLLPLPLTEESVRHISKRIQRVQEILEVPFAVENISYYASSGIPEMSEWEFVRAVVEESGALLLLDVNNIYVNSVNHGFNPRDYIEHMPLDRVAYVHIAGHYRKKKNFILDTHGEDIIHPVWKLLDEVLALAPHLPVMVERDGNIPPLPELAAELRQIHTIRGRHVAS